jgi:hypothetical protein
VFWFLLLGELSFLFFSLSRNRKKTNLTPFFPLFFYFHAPRHSHPGWVTPFIGVTAVFCTLSMIAANLSVSCFFGKSLTV